MVVVVDRFEVGERFRIQREVIAVGFGMESGGSAGSLVTVSCGNIRHRMAAIGQGHRRILHVSAI